MSNGNGQDDLISVYIDDEEVRVPKGTNMIEAAGSVGKEIPHYCYHPKLSVVGNCRMCLVELGMPGRDRATGEPMLNDDGTPKIMWMPKPAIACATTAAPGMHLKTESAMVKECREGVMEFLLVNHPLDCPICDQAGECRLQEFATDYGRGYSRFVEEKNVKPKRTRLGPRVMLDDERCILCSRCIRFCQEVAKDDVLGFIDRGSYSTLTCYPGKELANNYSLNTVDICPVGALTSTDFRFKMRVWFLKETASIDTESSVGCNIDVWSREGKIYRITPRRNDEVNDTWMPDSGRELYKQVEAENRLTQPTIDGQPVNLQQAIDAAAAHLKSGKVAIVGSGQMSVEEQYLLRRLKQATEAPFAELLAHLEHDDGLLLSRDRTPNTRGALVTGLIDRLPESSLPGLSEKVDAGEVDTVLTVREDLLNAGLSKAQLKKLKVIYLGTHYTPACECADVEIPLLLHFEKSGSFINQQFRLQRFAQAIPGPGGVLPDVMVWSRLLQQVSGADVAFTSPADVWKPLASEVEVLNNLAFGKIGAQGVQLDGSAWASLPFPEGPALHYTPAEVGATN